jgi:hypothetical protein
MQVLIQSYKIQPHSDAATPPIVLEDQEAANLAQLSALIGESAMPAPIASPLPSPQPEPAPEHRSKFNHPALYLCAAGILAVAAILLYLVSKGVVKL